MNFKKKNKVKIINATRNLFMMKRSSNNYERLIYYTNYIGLEPKRCVRKPIRKICHVGTCFGSR